MFSGLPAAYNAINDGQDTAPTFTSTTSNKRKSPTHDGDDYQPQPTLAGHNKRMRLWREDTPHPGSPNRNYSPSAASSPGTPSFTPVSARYSPNGHDQYQYQPPPPAPPTQPKQRTRTVTVITIPDDDNGSWTNQWPIEEQREVPIEDEGEREVIVISSDEENEDEDEGYDGDEEKDDDWEWEEEEEELEEGEIPEQEQEEEQDEWEREEMWAAAVEMRRYREWRMRELEALIQGWFTRQRGTRDMMDGIPENERYGRWR